MTRPRFTRCPANIDRMVLWFGTALFFKFLLFDFIWSTPTTFASFSTVEFYATKVIATLLLFCASPFLPAGGRRKRRHVADGHAAGGQPDVVFRTYYTAIPCAAAFCRAIWLTSPEACTTLSVGTEAFFPSPPCLHPPALRRRQMRERTSYRCYAVLSGIAIVLFAATTLLKGGFSAAYKAVRGDAHMCASTTSMYTVFGDMCHDLMSRKQTPSSLPKHGSR